MQILNRHAGMASTLLLVLGEMMRQRLPLSNTKLSTSNMVFEKGKIVEQETKVSVHEPDSKHEMASSGKRVMCPKLNNTGADEGR